MSLARVLAVAGPIVLLSGAASLQAARDRYAPLPTPNGPAVLYLRSTAAARRIALSYDALAADLYWMRAIQHYGSTKLSDDPNKSYDQLYPLLDLTTSLDPHFNFAYRFGAIFLSEPPPNGPGRPDLAIALLQKGLEAQPTRWELAQDVGFVHYWWRRDYRAAAEWFRRAAEIPGAPEWLEPLVAVTLTQGGNRASARQLWMRILAEAEHDWLIYQAQLRLRQLDALDEIDSLTRALQRYVARTGNRPRTWDDLLRSGALSQVPLDPAEHPYVLDGDAATIAIDPRSPLNPLPQDGVGIDEVPTSR